MPPNSPTIPLGPDRLRYYSGVHYRACPAKIGKSRARSANRFRLSTLLQIVPRVPGGIDGVGDYALTIARKLEEGFGCETVFAIPIKAFVLPPGWSSPSVEGFDLVALEHLL